MSKWDPWLGRQMGLGPDTTSFSTSTAAQRPYLPGLRVDLDDVDAGKYEHIFKYVASTPWAIQPQVLVVITDLLTYRMAGHRLEAEELEERIGRSPEAAAVEAARRRSEPRRAGGGAVALMSLYGVIAPRASMINSLSGPSGTGLDEFSQTLQAAVDDPEVGSVVIDVNSPGGSVDMVPETVARIRRAREQKPIYAVANTDAASAAYWLASQATELSVTPSGMVGSIGVYAAHQDVSAKLEMEGRKTTLISAGKYKVEGNPFEELSAEARESIQTMVSGYYDWFVDDVGRGRGVKASAVRSGFGEGRMVGAKAALAEGMVDRVETLEETIHRAMRGGGRARPAQATSAEDVTVAGNTELPAAAEIPVDHLQYLNL